MLCLRIIYARLNEIERCGASSVLICPIQCHLYSVICTLYSKKTFTSLFAHYRAVKPRIVKARSSHGIKHEHERAGA